MVVGSGVEKRSPSTATNSYKMAESIRAVDLRRREPREPFNKECLRKLVSVGLLLLLEVILEVHRRGYIEGGGTLG